MRDKRGRSSSTSTKRGKFSRFLTRPLAAIGLIAAIAATGAGCSGSEECLSTRSYFEQNVWSAFMSTKCAKCHTPDGIAAEQNAKFLVQPNSYPGFIDANLSNLQEVTKIEYQGKSELLLKPLGQMSHGGGAVLQEGDDDYKALVELVDRFSSGDSCTEAANETLSKVTNISAASTLRKATLNLAGRLPTAAEKAAVTKGGDAAIDAALDKVMKEDAFYDRLREIWNDVLLTDKWLEYDGAAIDFMNTDDYPALAPYRDGNDPKYKSAERPLINKALAREPLDLIAYVVKNNKPFTDVVASTYTVVNPYSAIAYGLDKSITFKDPTDYNEFHEAQITLATKAAIPHAGVLSTPSFLNRWTTSATNRNRGRARRVFQFFLATDVLKIAIRPVDATKVTAMDNPTRESDLCTVCHKVIDPVAGGFRGWDDQDYEHFDPMDPWHDEMFPPGFGNSKMDPNYYEKGLSWLGPQVASDPRFAISAVHTIFKGLTGHDPITYPADSTSPTFKTDLAAWSAQDAFLRQTADAFTKGNHDLKVIFKAVVKSTYFRGVSAAKGTDIESLESVGTGQLLSPELLNRKIAAVTGYRWREEYNYNETHDWLIDEYSILYGGIDSDGTITRLTAPNGIIAAVANRMANESSCRITSFDFTKGKKDRTLFPMVDLTEVPESSGHTVAASITDIKKNIQYLHELFLDEKLELDDPEIQRTYQLFLDTWHELNQAGNGGLSYECSAQKNPITGEDIDAAVQIKDDKTYTIRSWMAVVSYLLSDYKFLYE